MATEFGLKILSPSRSLASVKAKALTVPGLMGYMTILPDHTAMVAELEIGEMIVTDSDTNKQSSFFVSGGFVEVNGDQINVLADLVEPAKSIDVAKAELQKRDALEGLQGKSEVADLESNTKSLKEAEYRLKIAKTVTH